MENEAKPTTATALQGGLDRLRQWLGSSRSRINLALQGGGAHGAYTWGVLDALLEVEALELEGLSGSSAGAMNAVVLADGWLKGGRSGGADGAKVVKGAKGGGRGGRGGRGGGKVAAKAAPAAKAKKIEPRGGGAAKRNQQSKQRSRKPGRR